MLGFAAVLIGKPRDISSRNLLTTSVLHVFESAILSFGGNDTIGH
jgi:hypothetical protein